MNAIYIRTMKEEDIEEVAKLIQESYRTSYLSIMNHAYLSSLDYTYWLPVLQKSMRQEDVCLLAMHHKQIVGCAIASHSDEAKTAMLQAIYILPQYQNQHVGDQLYTCIEEVLKAHGFSTCQLEVLSLNHQAIKFYNKHGYDCMHTFTVEEDDRLLPCDLMEKTL